MGLRVRSSEDGYSAKMSMFDELLESGGTMKVSLTPDRMKVFEVCVACFASCFTPPSSIQSTNACVWILFDPPVAF